MNVKECSILMTMIRAYYPSYYARASEGLIKMSINLMQVVLEGIDAELATMAFYEYITNGNEFAPTAGQILAIAVDIERSFTMHMKGFNGVPILDYKSPRVTQYVRERAKLLLSKGN